MWWAATTIIAQMLWCMSSRELRHIRAHLVHDSAHAEPLDVWYLLLNDKVQWSGITVTSWTSCWRKYQKTSKKHPDVVNFILTSMNTWHMGSSRWYLSDLHLVTIRIYVVSPLRTGQVGASSQQKKCMPNSKVMWSSGIECKISIWTKNSCLSLGSGRLLLLPYALLALEFEEW